MQFAFILGQNKEVSINELYSLYKNNISYIHNEYCILDFDKKDKLIHQFGGIIKIFQILYESENLNNCKTFIIKHIKNKNLKSKIKFGINIYPERIFCKNILKDIKIQLKKDNISSRFLNKGNKNINSYINIYNQNMFEFGIFQKNNKFFIGIVDEVQDINEYRKLDIERPFRNMKVGIMSPKLSKILINFAGNNISNIYDPFCGDGTILMQGLYLNKNVIGSDISEKILEECKKNLEWFKNNFDIKNNYNLHIQDVCKIKNINFDFDAIVSEGYLGPKLDKGKEFSFNQMKQNEEEISNIYELFFKNIKPYIKYKQIIICIPFYILKNQNNYYFEKTLAKIQKLGYNLVSFYDNKKSIRYYKKGQRVGREIFKFSL